MKKIVALSCGRKNGMCETLLKEAAMGAEEFGIETEIIRALNLRVLPCNGCGACDRTGVCSRKDDVEWMLEKTCVEDAALIIGVPCYHVRANACFTAINERMNHLFMKDMSILKKTRVGAIIGVGGSGYDGWTSLNLPMVDIFMQHTRKVVDRIQINNCAIPEFNNWMRTDHTPVTHKRRVTDMDYEETAGAYGPPIGRVDFFKKSLERARELGRNVARAMNKPIEEAEYVGERSGVACPVCHANLLTILEDLPHVLCPACAVRGEIVIENGKMQVRWNEEDVKVPRFSYEGVKHHAAWIGQHYGPAQSEYFAALKELTAPHKQYGTIISPEKALAAMGQE